MKYDVVSRTNQRKKQIKKELLQGEKTFSELFDIFGSGNYSKSYLTKYLRELQEEAIVGKNKSGKYFLLEQAFDGQYEYYKDLHQRLKKRQKDADKKFNKILKSQFSDEEIALEIESAVRYYFHLYLTTLELTIRAPPKFNDLSWDYLREVTTEFLKILSIYGQKNGKITEEVLNKIRNDLR